MSDLAPVTHLPPPGLLRLTHLIYGLHAFSVVLGIATSVTIIGAFLFGLPSIAAVLLNYLKRGETQGTFLASHFRWQIRTFWYALLWGALCMGAAVLLTLTVIGLLVIWLPFAVVGLWVVYRIVRGWLALNEGRTVG